MISKKVSNYKELQIAVDELKADKLKQEDLIKQNVNGIKEALNPVNILKSTIKNLIEDKALHRDAIKAGLGIGAQYIIEKLFKTNKNPRRHFVANIFEKLITGFVK